MWASRPSGAICHFMNTSREGLGKTTVTEFLCRQCRDSAFVEAANGIVGGLHHALDQLSQASFPED